jgi:hypothetical protein
MWYQSQDIQWLPLFEWTKWKSTTPVSMEEPIQESCIGVSRIIDYKICSSCGEKAFVWESEGWFCTNCRTYDAIPGQIPEEINIHNYERILESKYQDDGENLWEITFHSIEDRNWYSVAIITICHSYPGKKFIHKGRKLWPTGKRDGEMTFTEKVSKGKTKKKQYRIHYDPSNVEWGIFVYGGYKKDGKEVCLNSRSIRRITEEINTLSFH